jgi:hypothetical protein
VALAAGACPHQAGAGAAAPAEAAALAGVVGLGGAVVLAPVVAVRPASALALAAAAAGAPAAAGSTAGAAATAAVSVPGAVAALVGPQAALAAGLDPDPAAHLSAGSALRMAGSGPTGARQARPHPVGTSMVGGRHPAGALQVHLQAMNTTMMVPGTQTSLASGRVAHHQDPLTGRHGKSAPSAGHAVLMSRGELVGPSFSTLYVQRTLKA